MPCPCPSRSQALPSRTRKSCLLYPAVVAASWEERQAEHRHLEVGAAGQEQASEPHRRGGLHREQAGLQDRVPEVRREDLDDGQEHWVREEVQGANQLESVEEMLQLVAAGAPQRLDRAPEPGEQEEPKRQESPPEGALVLVVLVGCLALELAEAHQHHVQGGHHGDDGPDVGQLQEPGAVQRVALRDDDEERGIHHLARHEEHFGQRVR
mmetsp:Transcript_78289/g.221370  ORF Transcript_78289/g.221370 Transcript_78289/m.221370 type:complete len:210 (-) Transcript_78289:855-1484(-)